MFICINTPNFFLYFEIKFHYWLHLLRLVLEFLPEEKKAKVDFGLIKDE